MKDSCHFLAASLAVTTRLALLLGVVGNPVQADHAAFCAGVPNPPSNKPPISSVNGR